MAQASLRNEGKVHLGFVYAKDDSGKTPALMLEASLKFAPLIERWLGRRLPWGEIRSNPFVYAVLADSMLGSDSLLESYQRLQERYLALIAGPALHYFGQRPERLWRLPDARQGAFARSLHQVRELIPTVEIALDLVQFRSWMERALAQQKAIDLRVGHAVEGVARTHRGFEVAGRKTDGSGWLATGDIVVNSLWANRLWLDQSFLGTIPRRKWVYRLKYRLLGRHPEALDPLPSMTFVVGPFGDIYPDTGGGRKRSGDHALTKTLKTMLAQTPLIKNLDNPQYMEIVLNGKASLAERFAEIDIAQVRKALAEAQNVTQKFPKRMAEVFKIPHLPKRLLETPSKKASTP